MDKQFNLEINIIMIDLDARYLSLKPTKALITARSCRLDFVALWVTPLEVLTNRNATKLIHNNLPGSC